MLSQILIWIYITILVFPIGFSVYKSFNRENLNDKPGFTDIIFLGYLILHVILSYITFFSPINLKLHYSIGAVALILYIIFWKSIFSFFRKFLSIGFFKPLFITIPSILILATIAAFSVYSFNHYDTGLYYLQNISWIENYPTLPGLAHIHSRFGFNSHFLIDSAFFKFNISDSDQSKISFYSLNSLLFIMFSLKGVSVMKRSFKDKDLILFTTVLVIIYLSFKIISKLISNPSPDLAGVILIGYFSILFLSKSFKQYSLYDFFIIALITACLATIKLSNALLALSLLVVLKSFKWSYLFLISATVVIVLFPFFYRNYIQTGFLIYPLNGLDLFNPIWKLPNSIVAGEYQWIKSYAIDPTKMPKEVLKMPIKEWFYEWFSRQERLIKVTLILIPISFFNFFLKVRDEFKILLIILLISTAYWFFSAPDPRFVWGILIAISGITLGGLTIVYRDTFNKQLFLAILTLYIYFFETESPIRKLKNALNDHPIIPYQAPFIETTSKDLGSFTIFVPLQGDQCFDNPLPCSTPYGSKSIELIGVNFDKGFKSK